MVRVVAVGVFESSVPSFFFFFLPPSPFPVEKPRKTDALAKSKELKQLVNDRQALAVGREWKA